MTADPTRSDLLARNYAKRGWIFILVGILIPVLAFVGAFIGWRLASADRREQGLPLIVVGLLVAGLRLYFYARTSFTSAW